MAYTINKAAEQTGITAHTIRYYEKEGIIPPIKRSESGIRLFSEDNLFWLEMVSCLKKTGMPVSDIKRIVALSMQGDATIPERKRILLAHKKVIRQQIEALEESMRNIDIKIRYYDGEDTCK